MDMPFGERDFLVAAGEFAGDGDVFQHAFEGVIPGSGSICILAEGTQVPSASTRTAHIVSIGTHTHRRSEEVLAFRTLESGVELRLQTDFFHIWVMTKWLK